MRISFNSLCSLALVFLLSVLETQGQELSDAARAKLNPTFLSIIDQSKTSMGWEEIHRLHQPAAVESDGTPVYNVILETPDPAALRAAGVHLNSVVGKFATARLRLPEIISLAHLDAVRYIDPGSVNYPTLDVSAPEVGVSLLHSGFLNGTPYKGAGAIVLIYDTGIDWRHHDFRNPQDTTKSRILFIWDQTLTPGAGESAPSGFSYGVEYAKAHIEDELDGTPTNYVRERDTNGHGTHVASTAAGNGNSFGGKYVGVAPGADIIVVKGGDNSFSEVQMIDGLTYAQTKATQLGKPIVVNWSIGGQSGPHDGTRAYEVASDQMVSNPGRVVSVSAGNDGASSIHVGGITSGGSATISVSVPSYVPNSGSLNDAFSLDVWFNGNQTATATVTSPNGIVYSRAAGETGLGSDDSDGRIDLSNTTSTLNGHRNIRLQVYDQDPTKPPRTGPWTLQISNVSSDVTYDGWLYSRTVGTASVTLPAGNTAKTVAMPATSNGAITVASYVTKWGWPTFDGLSYVYTGTDRTSNISTFSSIGPTRDDRQKPEIAAPGQGVSAALSSSVNTSNLGTRIHPGMKHWLIEGTSMAAPHVTGTSALLLGAFPSLTSAGIRSLLTTTANADAMTGSAPNYTWGYGKLDALEAVAKALSNAASVSRMVLQYDQLTSNQLAPTLTGSTRLALRISPSNSGKITRVMMMTTTPSNNPIVGSGSVRCELFSSVSSLPGTRIGDPVDWPLARMVASTLNSVTATAMNAEVSAGTEYFIVLSMTNPSDTLKLRMDDGSSGAGRSNRFDGSQWVAITQNLRVRVEVTTATGLVNVETVSVVPSDFELFQNFPNPFNPTSTIQYQLPAASRVVLKVFDVLGRHVTTLVDQEHVAGRFRVTWDGKDLRGSTVPSGVYFYRLDAAGYTETRKMVLVR